MICIVKKLLILSKNLFDLEIIYIIKIYNENIILF